MTTEAMTRPSISHRSPRTALLVVLALILGGVIGAGVVALTSSGTSDPSGVATGQASTPSVSAETCAGDGGALLAAMGSMPIDVSNRVANRLSVSTRAVLRSAAELSANTGTAFATPAATTLAGALARVGPADRAVLMSGLSPEVRAEMTTTAGSRCR